MERSSFVMAGAHALPALHWAPLRYAVSRPLRRPADIRTLAAEERVIAPREERIAARAIFQAEELSRIQGVQEDTSWDLEKRRILGGAVSHDATRLFKLSGALLSGSHVYLGASRAQVGNSGSLSFRPFRLVERVGSGVLCSSAFASQYFGHWITDQLSAELLAEELGIPAYASTRQNRFTHERALRRQTGLEARRGERVAFDELWIPVDHGQNASKRARYERLRSRLRADASPRTSRGVLILRGQHGAQRALVNEAVLAEQLAARGFEVVNPERASVQALRDLLHDAPIVIGVEGSALVHGIMLMPSNGCLVVVQPPQRFNNVLKDYTDCLGQRYAFTVADPAHDGFMLPPRRLFALLDLIAKTRN